MPIDATAPMPPRDPIEMLRASVRPVVTYLISGSFIAIAIYMIVVDLAHPEKLDIADKAFDAIQTVALLVIGFWFGNRSRAQRQAPPE